MHVTGTCALTISIERDGPFGHKRDAGNISHAPNEEEPLLARSSPGGMIGGKDEPVSVWRQKGGSMLQIVQQVENLHVFACLNTIESLWVLV